MPKFSSSPISQPPRTRPARPTARGRLDGHPTVGVETALALGGERSSPPPPPAGVYGRPGARLGARRVALHVPRPCPSWRTCCCAGRSSHRRDLPQTGRAAPGAHPALRPRRADDEQVHRTTARRSRRDPLAEPPPGVRRQPVLRGAAQDPEVPPRLPRALPRHHRRDRLLPNVLPLVQHRASPWRDRDAHPGRCASSSSPERAGPARADPSSRLDPSFRTLRSRRPKTGPPSRSGLDQSTRDIHNGRDRSVDRNRQCLEVVTGCSGSTARR